MKDVSPHSIGSVDFDCRVRRLYKALVEKSGAPQDVAFREQAKPLLSEDNNLKKKVGKITAELEAEREK